MEEAFPPIADAIVLRAFQAAIVVQWTTGILAVATEGVMEVGTPLLPAISLTSEMLG
jgi:hypothetical protein